MVGRGLGEMDVARDERGCFLPTGTSLPSDSQGAPRVLINKREIWSLPSTGDCSDHRHRHGAQAEPGPADRSRLKTDGTAGHFIRERWKK